jgi:hypothetical protein
VISRQPSAIKPIKSELKKQLATSHKAHSDKQLALSNELNHSQDKNDYSGMAGPLGKRGLWPLLDCLESI